MGEQSYRHIAIAISKKHARDRGAARADFEDGDDDDESEQYEAPDDLAACHTGQTAANYGVTIDVLKRLTAESLDIFGQVSRRWHKFLGCDAQQQSALEPPPSTSSSKRKGAAESGGEEKKCHPPRKRAKIASLEKLRAGMTAAVGDKKKDDMILRALRAVRLAAAKQSPLVAVLPTGGGKSLVFMVPAMLAGAGVTIVVAPFAELKRQLVTRCVDAGLDCKSWPEARESWPRVTLVSAEAAVTDDFLQWAADLSVRGRLDRVVIDECHLSFTAAETYRAKLRCLVLLRSLGCPFVFLTGTLPPLRQRDFEEAMQLQAPLYIRASSHRLNVRYSVLRVRNGRGVMEVKRLVDARLPRLAPGEKGVIYCTSHAKCRALARQLGCHYYHAQRDDSDAQFLAQREQGFQAWVNGETPYIVATAALGTGLDVAGIVHVIHLEAPFNLDDAVRCDNCRRDELLWKKRFEAALEEIEELGKMGCRICWMFDGVKEAGHQWGTCGATAEKDLSFSSCMNFQGLVNYKKDPQARFLSCFYCHVSQELCRDGYETKGASCRWKHAVVPMALAAVTEADIWSQR
ncbi:hypothetical protein LRP88_09333 [Fusarium phalaenopsidis]